MTHDDRAVHDARERWALVLGASSGMGEATSVALARAGYRIAGRWDELMDRVRRRRR